MLVVDAQACWLQTETIVSLPTEVYRNAKSNFMSCSSQDNKTVFIGGLAKPADGLKVTGLTWSLRIVLPSVAILFVKKEISDLDLWIAEHII